MKSMIFKRKDESEMHLFGGGGGGGGDGSGGGGDGSGSLNESFSSPPPPPPGPPPPPPRKKNSRSNSGSRGSSKSNRSGGDGSATADIVKERRRTAMDAYNSVGLANNTPPPQDPFDGAKVDANGSWSAFGDDKNAGSWSTFEEPSNRGSTVTSEFNGSEGNNDSGSWAAFDERVNNVEKIAKNVSGSTRNVASDTEDSKSTNDPNFFSLDSENDTGDDSSHRKNVPAKPSSRKKDDEKGKSTFGKVKGLFKKGSKKGKKSSKSDKIKSHIGELPSRSSTPSQLEKQRSVKSNYTAKPSSNAAPTSTFQKAGVPQPSQSFTPSFPGIDTTNSSQTTKQKENLNLFPDASFSPPKFDPSPRGKDVADESPNAFGNDLNASFSSYPDPDIAPLHNKLNGPESDEDKSRTSDEVSEMTNPTFVDMSGSTTAAAAVAAAAVAATASTSSKTGGRGSFTVPTANTDAGDGGNALGNGEDVVSPTWDSGNSLFQTAQGAGANKVKSPEGGTFFSDSFFRTNASDGQPGTTRTDPFHVDGNKFPPGRDDPNVHTPRTSNMNGEQGFGSSEVEDGNLDRAGGNGNGNGDGNGDGDNIVPPHGSVSGSVSTPLEGVEKRTTRSPPKHDVHHKFTMAYEQNKFVGEQTNATATTTDTTASSLNDERSRHGSVDEFNDDDFDEFNDDDYDDEFANDPLPSDEDQDESGEVDMLGESNGIARPPSMDEVMSAMGNKGNIFHYNMGQHQDEDTASDNEGSISEEDDISLELKDSPKAAYLRKIAAKRAQSTAADQPRILAPAPLQWQAPEPPQRQAPEPPQQQAPEPPQRQAPEPPQLKPSKSAPQSASLLRGHEQLKKARDRYRGNTVQQQNEDTSVDKVPQKILDEVDSSKKLRSDQLKKARYRYREKKEMLNNSQHGDNNSVNANSVASSCKTMDEDDLSVVNKEQEIGIVSPSPTSTSIKAMLRTSRNRQKGRGGIPVPSQPYRPEERKEKIDRPEERKEKVVNKVLLSDRRQTKSGSQSTSTNSSVLSELNTPPPVSSSATARALANKKKGLARSRTREGTAKVVDNTAVADPNSESNDRSLRGRTNLDPSPRATGNDLRGKSLENSRFRNRESSKKGAGNTITADQNDTDNDTNEKSHNEKAHVDPSPRAIDKKLPATSLDNSRYRNRGGVSKGLVTNVENHNRYGSETNDSSLREKNHVDSSPLSIGKKLSGTTPEKSLNRPTRSFGKRLNTISNDLSSRPPLTPEKPPLPPDTSSFDERPPLPKANSVRGLASTPASSMIAAKHKSMNRISKRHNKFSHNHDRRSDHDLHAAALILQGFFDIIRAKTEARRRRRLAALSRPGRRLSRQQFETKTSQSSNQGRKFTPSIPEDDHTVDSDMSFERRHILAPIRENLSPTASLPGKLEPTSTPNKRFTRVSRSRGQSVELPTNSTPRKTPRKFNQDSRREEAASPVPSIRMKGRSDNSTGLSVVEQRILSCAAIPIQTEIRRILAQIIARHRLWAVVTIQAYSRRWLCENYLFNSVYCATKIQSMFRGWMARDSLDDEHFCATEIQKIVRGHLCVLNYHDDLCSIIIAQSVVRRYFAINSSVERLSAIVQIQAVYRSYKAQAEYDLQHYESIVIQTAWRRFSAQLRYQFDLVDIIIVQSIARRWKARRIFRMKMHHVHQQKAVIIQSKWRSYNQSINYLNTIADVIIVQSVVRRWSAYWTVEEMRFEKNIVFVQSAVRRWLACMKADDLRFNRDLISTQCAIRCWLARIKLDNLRFQKEHRLQTAHAVVIQKYWRGYSAQIGFLLSLVHIIIVQSVARRYLARKPFCAVMFKHKSAKRIQRAWKRKKQEETLNNAVITIQKHWRGFMEYSNYIIVQFENQSAITIQKYWRGFWRYSHYVILQFEVIRIQAVVRGFLERNFLLMQNLDAITIQCAIRQFLARKELNSRRLNTIILRSAALSMQMTNCGKKIQRFFRSRSTATKEKKAALVIERFFIMVKIEVDREIQRREKQRQEKREKRRRKKKEADDKLLERVWLNTSSLAGDEPQVAQKSKQRAKSQIKARKKYERDVIADAENPGNYGMTNAVVPYVNPDMADHPRHRDLEHDMNYGLVNVGHANPYDIHHQPTQRNAPSGPPQERYMVENMANVPQKPIEAFAMNGDTLSEVSGITSPTIFHRPAKATPSRQKESRVSSLSKKDLNDDYSLEEAWIDTEIQQTKERRKNNHEYIQRNGLTMPSKNKKYEDEKVMKGRQKKSTHRKRSQSSDPNRIRDENDGKGRRSSRAREESRDKSGKKKGSRRTSSVDHRRR